MCELLSAAHYAYAAGDKLVSSEESGNVSADGGMASLPASIQAFRSVFGGLGVGFEAIEELVAASVLVGRGVGVCV